MTKLDAALAAKLCAEAKPIAGDMVLAGCPGVADCLRALAEQLMAALEELTRLRSDEATMKLSRMLGLGDPVRPDIHASVCRQRDAARREVEKMRAVCREAALYCSPYGTDASDLDGAVEKWAGKPVDSLTYDAIDAALSQDKDLP